MKALITSVNVFILIAIIFFLAGIILFFFAFQGMAIAVPFFTKVLFVLSFLCFTIAVVFYFLKKKVKVKMEEK